MPASNLSVTYADACRRMLTYAFENRLVHDLAAASGMPASNLSVADVSAVATGAGDAARMLEVRTATKHFGKAETKKGEKNGAAAHICKKHPWRMSLRSH